MITRVYGTVDGTDVIMYPDGAGKWSVPVPLDADGVYIVEIIAENDAGQSAYVTRMLFCVDSSRLCAKVIPLPYAAAVLPSQYRAELMEGG